MHRVLLDFTCDAADVISTSDAIRSIQRMLVEDGWSTESGDEEHIVINRMAVQLPASDVAAFVRNTKHAMSRKGPHADLTLGYNVDWEVGKLTIRIRSDVDAVLADLGRKTADKVLSMVPQLKLAQMDLYQERHDQPIVQGGESVQEGFRLLTFRGLTITLPLFVSLGYLTLGALVAHHLYWSESPTEIMGEALWVWYGRLFGPMVMAFITTSATLAREMRENPAKRIAIWHTAKS